MDNFGCSHLHINLINSKIIRFRTPVNGVRNYYFACPISTSLQHKSRRTISNTKKDFTVIALNGKKTTIKLNK